MVEGYYQIRCNKFHAVLVWGIQSNEKSVQFMKTEMVLNLYFRPIF